MSIDFIKHSKGKKIMVQMKNGTYVNGILENIDMFMNIRLAEVSFTHIKDSKTLHCADVCFLRGTQVASINFEEDLLENISNPLLPQEDSNLQSKTSEKPPNEFLNRKRANDNDYGSNDRGRGNYRGRGNDRGRGFHNDRGRYNHRGDRGRGKRGG